MDFKKTIQVEVSLHEIVFNASPTDEHVHDYLMRRLQVAGVPVTADKNGRLEILSGELSYLKRIDRPSVLYEWEGYL